jgi:hypothetical protein
MTKKKKRESNARDKTHRTMTREEDTLAEEVILAEEDTAAEEDTLLEEATKAIKKGQERTAKKKKSRSPIWLSKDGSRRHHLINNFQDFQHRREIRLQNGRRRDFQKFSEKSSRKVLKKGLYNEINKSAVKKRRRKKKQK